jgi:FtsP/CotA-like multicopper oxidase with cupredoxin domain
MIDPGRDHLGGCLIRRQRAAPSSIRRDQGRRLSRRRFVAGGVGLGGATLLAAGGQRSAWGADATPAAGHDDHGAATAGADGRAAAPEGIVGMAPWTSSDLVAPEVRRSVDGVLSTTLRVQYATKEVGGYRLFVRTYEGTIPGPTLRVQPGDQLQIALINDLPPNRDVMPLAGDLPHHFNTTNFHFHGSHVSPGGISDNIFREMEPGQRYDIAIAIPPTHPRGTYWYHPHHHGGADIQIASGMAGALIVEGDFADVPEIANATDQLLLLGQGVFDPWRTVESFDTLFSEGATRFFTVNGQREPIIRLRPGEVRRWRILHAGYQDDIFLALDGHALHPIARDGIALPRMDQPGICPCVAAADDPGAVLLAPGQRVDVLVQAGEPGTYTLRALPFDQGYPAPAGPVAHVVVAGEPLPMALPAVLPTAPLRTIRDEELTGARQLTFSRIAPEVDAAGQWQEFTFQIDGHGFDPDRVDQAVKLGAVEEWTVTNLDEHNDHVFHIHVNPFQVTKVNGQPVSEPVWLDTVVVPHNGSVTFRSRFLDFTGRCVLHCHMMNHEELGMMQVVEVTGAG